MIPGTRQAVDPSRRPGIPGRRDHASDLSDGRSAGHRPPATGIKHARHPSAPRYRRQAAPPAAARGVVLRRQGVTARVIVARRRPIGYTAAEIAKRPGEMAGRIG